MKAAPSNRELLGVVGLLHAEACLAGPCELEADLLAIGAHLLVPARTPCVEIAASDIAGATTPDKGGAS